MKSLRSEIISNFAKMQEEAKCINHHLKNILDQNSKIADDVKELQYRDFSSNKQHYLNITGQQHNVIQKLLGINADLEEFLSVNDFRDSKNTKTMKFAEELAVSLTESNLTETNFSCQDNTLNFEQKTEIVEKWKQFNLNNNMPGLLSNFNILVQQEVEPTCQSRSSDFAANGELKTEIIEKLNHFNLLNVKERNLQNLLSDCKIPDEVNQMNEFVDSFTESDDEQDFSGCGMTVDGSDFTDDDESKVERLKRLNLLSKKERNKYRKLDYEESSDRDQKVETMKRRKEKKIKSSEEVIEAPVEVTVKPEEKKAEEVKEIVNNAGEVRENKVEDVKPWKALTKPPVPFIGMSCLISHIISPSEFYINPSDDNITTLENISQDVADLYAGSYTPYKTKLDAKKNLGCFCLCYLPKWNYWYRAEVVNWHLKAWGYRENIVTVFIVDFGYITDTSYINLRELPDRYCTIPKYAIKCHLNKLRPLGATEWSIKSLDTMRDLVGPDNEKIFKIVSVHKERGDSYAVDLVKANARENGKTLVEKLVDRGVATTKGPTTNIVTITNSKVPIDETENSTDSDVINTLYGKNPEIPPLMSVHVAPCLYFARNGYCGKVSCKYSHFRRL